MRPEQVEPEAPAAASSAAPGRGLISSTVTASPSTSARHCTGRSGRNARSAPWPPLPDRSAPAPTAGGCRSTGEPEPPSRLRRAHCSLKPSTCAVPAVPRTQCRDRPARGMALPIPAAAAGGPARGRADMSAARAADTLAQPAAAVGRPVSGGPPDGRCPTRAASGESERVLDPSHFGGIVAPQSRPAASSASRPGRRSNPDPQTRGIGGGASLARSREQRPAPQAPDVGRPAPAARPPRPRVYPGRRRRRARSAQSRRPAPIAPASAPDSAQIRTGSAGRMPARRRERLGHADVPARLARRPSPPAARARS